MTDMLSQPEWLDQLFEGAYVVDRNRKILFWNRAAQEITGFTREDVTGRQCWEGMLRHLGTDGQCLCHTTGCPTEKAMSDNAITDMEIFMQHKNGHRIPVCVRTAPIRDAEGTVTGALEVMSDRSREKVREQRIAQLEQLALLDSLTLLANRRHMEAVLSSAIERVRRFHQPFGLLFIDIDDFKKINDTYGHDRGDEVLRVVARTLQSGTRPFDTASRWGGEEFLVLCEQVSHDELETIAERYRILVQGSSVHVGNDPLAFTVSIGGTLITENDSLRALVERADKQMYRSKGKGKNCVSIHDEITQTSQD